MLAIRPATRQDLPALEWEGQYLHFRRMYMDTYQMMEDGRAMIWVGEIPALGIVGQLFVSYKGGRPELADGMIRAYVYGFRVRPAYRNLGIGTHMMHVAEVDLWERGYHLITLNVARVNHAALRFYERLGYHIVAADPGRWSYLDHTGCRREVHEPAWRMEKTLSAPSD
jgi:ribosomal protein S18 acetylase RimI-like enzyme